MSITLLPTFMIRLSRIKVDECPKFPPAAPSANNHPVYSREHKLSLPLKLDGIISYLPFQITGKYELNTPKIKLLMNPIQEVWNPHDPIYH